MRPIQGTFLLAEEAQIGTYNIYVNGKGSASCQFSVEEYVLPKFGLEISGNTICFTFGIDVLIKL